MGRSSLGLVVLAAEILGCRPAAPTADKPPAPVDAAPPAPVTPASERSSSPAKVRPPLKIDPAEVIACFRSSALTRANRVLDRARSPTLVQVDPAATREHDPCGTLRGFPAIASDGAQAWVPARYPLLITVDPSNLHMGLDLVTIDFRGDRVETTALASFADHEAEILAFMGGDRCCGIDEEGCDPDLCEEDYDAPENTAVADRDERVSERVGKLNARLATGSFRTLEPLPAEHDGERPFYFSISPDLREVRLLDAAAGTEVARKAITPKCSPDPGAKKCTLYSALGWYDPRTRFAIVQVVVLPRDSKQAEHSYAVLHAEP